MKLNKRRSNLSKYDAPLKIQYQAGYTAFHRGGYFNSKNIFVQHTPNIDRNTMQYREWQRGWNDAYFGKPMVYDLGEEKHNGLRGRS